MDVTPLIPEGRQIIEGYGDGRFRITGVVHEGAVLVMPTKTVAWAATGVSDVDPATLAPILDAETVPEILLVGTGARTEFVPPTTRAAVRERGPVVDVMDTGAACRTYNVLMAEGRLVAAALLPVGG